MNLWLITFHIATTTVKLKIANRLSHWYLKEDCFILILFASKLIISFFFSKYSRVQSRSIRNYEKDLITSIFFSQPKNVSLKCQWIKTVTRHDYNILKQYLCVIRKGQVNAYIHIKKGKGCSLRSKLSIKILEVDELESRALWKYIWQDWGKRYSYALNKKCVTRKHLKRVMKIWNSCYVQEEKYQLMIFVLTHVLLQHLEPYTWFKRNSSDSILELESILLSNEVFKLISTLADYIITEN